MSQSSISTSIPDAQPDPFREAFRPPSLMAIADLLNPLPDPGPASDLCDPSGPDPDSPDPDSSDSDLQNSKAPATTRDERIAIQTALRFRIRHARIREVLHVTEKQIRYARKHQATPQKSKAGRKPLLRTPQRNHLQQWLLESPSHRRIPFQHIPQHMQFPGIDNVGGHAIKTAFHLLGYCRRTSKKKGYSDDPEVKQERLTFAHQAILWTAERLYCQMFTDEVWAMGGAHTTSYVTVLEDGSD